MNPTLEIFSQGEEIVTGQTVDTNAAWLSEQAVQLGFTVTRHTAVGDKLDDLIALLKEISQRADACLCTGGLGPTSDDLTADAVAAAFGLPLQFDETAYRQIRQFFSARNRPMPATNRKQAMLPEGSLRLDNDWGTAPGFALQAGRCWFAFLPGVPSEMRAMFDERVAPLLTRRFTLNPPRLITLKTFGLGESDIQQRLAPIQIPDTVQLGFRAGVDEVQTKLLFPAGYPEQSLEALIHDMAHRLGDFVFAVDGLEDNPGNLASVVDKLMTDAGKTLAVIETTSQGLLAAKCLGSSWLISALYADLPALEHRLGVAIDPENLPQTATRLAQALKNQTSADFILVQLYEGAREQFHDRNRTIILYNTLLLEDDTPLQKRHCVAGAGERKQNQAALLGLDLLRRHLQHLT